ncbi:AI-2E family transporter [Thiorhodococcus mannitoliphagus]|uniref:AI-2E family transporter n=2 Tax=Thiorhodococcus mannitoliphagus TaxID=329406 RepID=A0A6P1E5H0_9GAMM|nr:AI-2E family transporter [Thiorhodococcus mannitoliphagus]NEX22825.1 AI-2E family transporter [Thiorhodococcus mannitoliphagus]
MSQDAVNKTVILLMTLGISALFLAMIQQFLMALFLAGLFSALARPLYIRLRQALGCNKHLASLLTLLAMAFVVLLPAVMLIAVLIGQALDVSQLLSVWLKGAMEDPADLMTYLQHLPFYDQVLEHRDLILQQVGGAASLLSKLLLDWVSSATLGTVNFIFMAFVLLYSMYFLQMDGPRLIELILYYLPLKTSEERLMLEKFTSVTRATLKGSLLIGLLQGTLAGIAFAVAGIDNAVFWGTVMAVLSVIPNVGAALVWIPTVIILIAQGDVVTGVSLGLFCGLVVGSLDNVLRPILVGKDTKMHELMIFFSTLGGIFMFGLAGLFIGPLIASLLISIWEIYGVEFADVLPDVDSLLLDFGEAQDQADTCERNDAATDRVDAAPGEELPVVVDAAQDKTA